MKYKADITLQYQDKTYNFVDPWLWHDFNTALFDYEQGNDSCDCTRSGHIADHCDKDFPHLPCGNTITLVSIKPIEIGETA
jgi:hypothetical protein